MINTLFLGKVLKHFSELESTNDYAKEILSKSKPVEGMVIIADNQTAGRGQYGSTWENEPSKALLLSVILYPKFLGVSRQFQLCRAVALGVRAFCASSTGEGYSIKWPNDIYKNNRKCAGILIESNLQGSNIESSVIGIGINLSPLALDTHLTQATSVFADDRHIDKEQLLSILLWQLEHYYLQLRQGKTERLEDEYQQYLYKKDLRSTYELPDGKQIIGSIVGTDISGRLIIQTDDSLHRFASKEVRMIP